MFSFENLTPTYIRNMLCPKGTCTYFVALLWEHHTTYVHNMFDRSIARHSYKHMHALLLCCFRFQMQRVKSKLMRSKHFREANSRTLTRHAWPKRQRELSTLGNTCGSITRHMYTACSMEACYGSMFDKHRTTYVQAHIKRQP